MLKAKGSLIHLIAGNTGVDAIVLLQRLSKNLVIVGSRRNPAAIFLFVKLSAKG